MPRIEEMYAFVAEDTGPDDEGVVGFMADTGWMPMVGADMKRVKSLRPIAEEIARTTGKKIKLLHFTQRSELEVIVLNTPGHTISKRPGCPFPNPAGLDN